MSRLRSKRPSSDIQTQISYIKSTIEYLSERRKNQLYNIFEKYTFLIKHEKDKLKIEESLITPILDELKKIEALLETKKTKFDMVEDYNFEKIETLVDEYNKKVNEYSSIKNLIMTYLESSVKNQKQLEAKIKSLFLEKYYVKFIEMSTVKDPVKYNNELEATVNALNSAIWIRHSQWGPKSIPMILKTGAKKVVPIFSIAMIFGCR